MLHQWFTCVHLLDTYLANLKEGFQLSFHYPSVSIRAAQSGLQSVPAYRMRWGCHHLFRSYDGNPSNIANIRLHSVSGHTISMAKLSDFKHFHARHLSIESVFYPKNAFVNHKLDLNSNFTWRTYDYCLVMTIKTQGDVPWAEETISIL